MDRILSLFLSIFSFGCIGGANVLGFPDGGGTDASESPGPDGGGVCCPFGPDPCTAGNGTGGWAETEADCASHVHAGVDGRWQESTDAHGCNIWNDVTAGGKANVCCGLCPGPTPVRPHYRLVQEANGFSVSHQRCQAVEGQPVFLHAEVVPLGSCDSPAPIRVSVDAELRTIRVEPYVWRRLGEACDPVTDIFEREVLVENLTTGTWTVRYPVGTSESEFPLEVSPVPPAACTFEVPIEEGEMCFGDCDCVTGLRCVPIEGDAVCTSVCAAPCERSGSTEITLACNPDRECTTEFVGGFVAGTACGPRRLDECSAGSCPEGLTCISDSDATSYCDWGFTLNDARRHECLSNSDCTDGMDCVAHADTTRRCEVRCNTGSMRCPPGHGCNSLGVCDWLED